MQDLYENKNLSSLTTKTNEEIYNLRNKKPKQIKPFDSFNLQPTNTHGKLDMVKPLIPSGLTYKFSTEAYEDLFLVEFDKLLDKDSKIVQGVLQKNKVSSICPPLIYKE